MGQEVLTDEFDAVSGNGRKFHICVYTDMIDAGTMDNPNAVIPGMRTMVTDEGYNCSPIDDDHWQIVDLELLKVSRVQ